MPYLILFRTLQPHFIVEANARELGSNLSVAVDRLLLQSICRCDTNGSIFSSVFLRLSVLAGRETNPYLSPRNCTQLIEPPISSCVTQSLLFFCHCCLKLLPHSKPSSYLLPYIPGKLETRVLDVFLEQPPFCFNKS